jgi:cytosine deaminase
MRHINFRSLTANFIATAKTTAASTMPTRISTEQTLWKTCTWASLPLSVKQDLVGNLHDGVAYTEESLRTRMTNVLEQQLAAGVKRIDTNIDATPDLPEEGLLAIRVAQELKKKFAGRLKLRIAPTPIFGFKDGTTRWSVFEAAAQTCDFLSLLPEKDDYFDKQSREGKAGFKRHIRMGLELACTLGKEVQFHLDQANLHDERGTERLLDCLEVLDQPNIGTTEPSVWVIHMISPSAYDECRFARLVDRLLEHNVGVIVCPSAALSMRQLRSVYAPTHNSIARVLELIKKKVPLRLGTDNIADVFVPTSDGNMLTEVKIAANALRLNQPSIWAKLACGKTLNNVDIATVGRVLHEDRKACQKANCDWKAGIE